MKKTICNVCHHQCHLSENQLGLCRARAAHLEKVVSINYGLLTSIAFDPIEKKPLRRFYPGSKILSIGSFGCNLKCQFCQNHEISMTTKENIDTRYVSPVELINMAKELIPRGNIGIAYTYNEPLVGYEYVLDCAKLARENGLKNVVVTNGCFSLEILEELLPYIDAMNIDLKGFSQDFYHRIGGDFEKVKNFIKHASKVAHVEVTTLIIPENNDSEEEIRNLSKFISSINSDIPLHLSRFFPNYLMKDTQPTKVQSIYNLSKIAREYLTYVYEGNI